MKLGVLISGRGSNLQALIDAGFDIALVISNVAGAGGLARAEKVGIPTKIISHKDFPTREDFDAELHKALKAAGVELVCLAGFMRIITPGFINLWPDRMVNIHPSLLPAYKGVNTHSRALADGVKFTGCTVHFVRPDVDSGPIILQATVPILPEDEEANLAVRVLEMEHKIYPMAVRLIVEKKVEVKNGIVHISEEIPPMIWGRSG